MIEFGENEVQTSSVSDVRNTLAKTFLWMFMGLLATAIVAVFCAMTGITETFALNGGLAIACVLEIVTVLVFSLCFRKLSSGAVTVLFFLYSMISGITISTIFFVYELNSIVLAFFGTAGVFGTLAYMGYKTDRDISSMGTILMTGLIISIIVSIVNLFIMNSILEVVLNWVILAIFLGFTVYDMNKIKMLLASGTYDSEKVAIYGAMELYLDFINLFLRILAIFGRRRD